MTVLRSYTEGTWRSPSSDGVPMLDAVTGEEVGRVSSAGIDMAAALEDGRTAGGPPLRALTFPQRAPLPRALGSSLRRPRERRYRVSPRPRGALGGSNI